jgi:hypothetical protein
MRECVREREKVDDTPRGAGAGWSLVVSTILPSVGFVLSRTPHPTCHRQYIITPSSSPSPPKTKPHHHPTPHTQIAGRAGRFQSRFEEGVVSARTRGDLARIAHALTAADEPVAAAGVAPTREQLQLFARANGLRLRETEEDYALALEARRRAGRRAGRVRVCVRGGAMCVHVCMCVCVRARACVGEGKGGERGGFGRASENRD